MRKVITLEVEKPKIDQAEIKRQVADIVTLFDGYLDEYPLKGGRSKHTLMGPVAKVLDRAQAGQWDAEPLTGYAVRMHEMNPLTGGRVSQTAVARLREGTEKLLTLCHDVPVTALASTVEQIDYNVYFRRWVKSRQWLEQRQAELVAFLNEKYGGDDVKFCKAWAKKKGSKIAEQYFFGAGSKTYKNGTDVLHADMDEFYKQMSEKGEELETIAEDAEEA
jgi:hypothetical protein